MAQKKPPDRLNRLIWEGTIRIKKSGSKDYNKEKKTTSMNSHSSEQITHLDEAMLEICGSANKIFIKDVTRTYIYNSKKTSFKQDVSKHCPLPSDAMKHNILYREKNYPSNVKKPGDKREVSESTIKNIYSSKDCKSPKEMTFIRLKIYPDGKYQLLVESKVYTETKINNTNTTTYACDGKQKKKTFRVATCGFNEKEETIVNSEGNIVSKLRPKLLHIAAVVEGQIQDNSIVLKEKPLAEVKPKYEGDYQETLRVSALLRGKNPCQIVYNEMMADISWAEAFAKTEIRHRARNIKNYKYLVRKKAIEIYKSRTGSDPPGVDSVNMRTNEDCAIDKKDEYRKQIMDKCLPYVLYKRTLSHEKEHVDQCIHRHTEFMQGMNDPQTHGMMEVGAYLVGIKKLFYWLKDNCVNHDLAEVEAVINNIDRLHLMRKIK
ncbi:MAG: hypothetical protein GY702_10155 [Desulfobulbaceae bacterium]|nr:hypothetical protein [Desulfobulbaceae bacterium]